MGRAFSVHTFAGFLGGAIAPAILLTLAAYGGLETALSLPAARAGDRASSLLMPSQQPSPAARARPLARKSAAGAIAMC